MHNKTSRLQNPQIEEVKCCLNVKLNPASEPAGKMFNTHLMAYYNVQGNAIYNHSISYLNFSRPTRNTTRHNFQVA